MSIAAFDASRSVVGDTSTEAVPAKATRPRLMPGVSPSANYFAASCAASSRVGWTSVASIDSDTSMTSITVARLRGTRLFSVGPASAIGQQNTSPTSSSAIGMCRQQLGPLRRHLLEQLHVA